MSDPIWTEIDDTHLALHRLAPTNPLAEVLLVAWENDENRELAYRNFIAALTPLCATAVKVIQAFVPLSHTQETGT